MKCAYKLSGLAVEGACPECEQGYDPGSVAKRRPPTASGTIVAFGWPLGVFAMAVFSLTVGWAGASGDDGLSQLLLAVAVFGFLINLPYQYTRLRNWDGGAASGKRNMLYTGPAAVMMVISLVLLVPFVLIGGCLVLILAGSR
jgi:hypothetical protein